MTNALHTAGTEMSIGGIFAMIQINVMVNFKPGEYMRKMFLLCK